jgi:hypothetical protein
LLAGRVAEQMGDLEHALSAYESALRHNPTSLAGLTQVAGIARIKENYPKASWLSCSFVSPNFSVVSDRFFVLVSHRHHNDADSFLGSRILSARSDSAGRKRRSMERIG